MSRETRITQHPEPGAHLCKIQGDTLEITIDIDPAACGNCRAWVRTNIGRAAILRNEIIAHVDDQAPMLGRGWFDIPMRHDKKGRYAIVLGLSEVGHFEAKCFVLPPNAPEPLWPPGGNLVINVEPADTFCGNTLYNAFVRQFGPGKTGPTAIASQQHESIDALDQAGYTIIPPSGTFRSLIADLDFIVGTLGCRIIQLLPIHPTPTTYGRMGRFGSPYAALSFIAVDPALAEFDPKATPLEQFLELVDAVHARNAKLFLDIAINHTGWAASLHATHPQWLVRNQAGEIEMPAAWGVTWADLTRLDYEHKSLWQYMAEIFLTWCRRGVDGFRCDAGYMIPTPAWQYIIARVRSQFPDALFLLEGLGGPVRVTRDLLNQANFNWAYSELFQNYDRGQVKACIDQAGDISKCCGLTFHFAETHDNNRLAATDPVYARMRTALCALLSFQGAFGFANGVEWLATEKIDVHGSPSLNWGAADNQVIHIGRLCRILKTHPAFFHGSRMEWLNDKNDNVVCLLRSCPDTEKNLLVVINLDHRHPNWASWPGSRLQMPHPAVDLLSGRKIDIASSENMQQIELAPGEALCLTPDPEDLKRVEKNDFNHLDTPERVVRQRLRAKVLEIYGVLRGATDLRDIDPTLDARNFTTDPRAFCNQINPTSNSPAVTQWFWPRDSRREVMVPPGHFLLVWAGRPFTCRVQDTDGIVLASEKSFQQTAGSYFALVLPLAAPAKHTRRQLVLSIFNPKRCQHAKTPLLYLSAPRKARVKTVFQPGNGEGASHVLLGTNRLGSMMRSHLHWGHLQSRYDGLLAANLNPMYPDDRRIMLTRCRGWAVFQGYSQEIGPETLLRFGFEYSATGCWEYKIPTGHGGHIRLTLVLKMLSDMNRVHLIIYRHPAGNHEGRLPDNKPIDLILRPDIEDRNFHSTTKAFTGPENDWQHCVTPGEKGFVFNPEPAHRLHVNVTAGHFVTQTEWQYMVPRQLEKNRGLDPHSDLFSPGYFTARLKGGEYQVLTATASIDEKTGPDVTGADVTAVFDFFQTADHTLSIPDAMRKALDQYIVRREGYHTVVAGYPWFLDWGRDTLIVTRGLIAAGKIDVARSIIKQFAGHEKNGTLPNMLHGADTANRDTSDAPLWLFTICSDMARAEDSDTIFTMDCGGRSLGSVLVSLARALVAGTPNRVQMDPASGLLFSPAHFSWMDTNHPAGTPRQGYPIEIQTLWHAALTLLSQIDVAKPSWAQLADQVRQSIKSLFFLEKEGYLSDCLHCETGVPAHQATPDNALRPNQLLAITLNALTDRAMTQQILAACEPLLVPGAIRSLGDQPVHPPLEIVHNGELLNTPETPYHGRYEGAEDTHRKPAYHNGTAWTWLFPSYSEAWFKVYGEMSRETALSWLASSTELINSGCVGHVPEILDGDAPHRQRGCDAQAWGVSELLRVWTLIER